MRLRVDAIFWWLRVNAPTGWNWTLELFRCHILVLLTSSLALGFASAQKKQAVEIRNSGSRASGNRWYLCATPKSSPLFDSLTEQTQKNRENILTALFVSSVFLWQSCQEICFVLVGTVRYPIRTEQKRDAV